MGVLLAMRAKLTTLMGMMITASHNHKDDNGIKMIESDGSMLDMAWEPLANEIANSKNLKQTLIDFNESEERLKFGFLESIFAPVSFVQTCFAMDTRETSPKLLDAAMKGCELMGIQTNNFGLCTTP